MMVEGTPKTTTEEQSKRMESIQQENRVLKMEVETYKLKCKQLQEDNRELRKASVSIVSKAHLLRLPTALTLWFTSVPLDMILLGILDKLMWNFSSNASKMTGP